MRSVSARARARHARSATSADDVVPELRDPGKESVRGVTDRPYAITSRGPMSASKRLTIAKFLDKIDDVWARKSPLLEEWRRGRQESKSVFDPLYEAVMNISASVRIYRTSSPWSGSASCRRRDPLLLHIRGERPTTGGERQLAFISFAIIFPSQTPHEISGDARWPDVSQGRQAFLCPIIRPRD